MENWPTPVVLAIAGCLGGIVLGLAARLARFCTLSAIEDAMFGHDLRRLRMWALALGVAILGVTVLAETGTVDFSQTLYHRLTLNPLAWVLGGLMFGAGMALCGTCGYGTLARVGGGDLRALFGFLVIGIAAYMAIAGPTAQLRVWLIDPLAIGGAFSARTFIQWIGSDVIDAHLVEIAVPSVAAALLLAWSLGDGTFRRSKKHVFWGVMVGLAIVSGWASTGWLARDPF
ncbi:MAG: YeeE/YedE family protein, partial [Gammaproteobacteria bacterium]|nr:YeeE/YedE family protein [Gammaproteobacteria bacterium]